MGITKECSSAEANALRSCLLGPTQQEQTSALKLKEEFTVC
jgi:hypothetical protein